MQRNKQPHLIAGPDVSRPSSLFVAPAQPHVGLNMLLVCRAVPQLQEKMQGSSETYMIISMSNPTEAPVQMTTCHNLSSVNV